MSCLGTIVGCGGMATFETLAECPREAVGEPCTISEEYRFPTDVELPRYLLLASPGSAHAQ